MSKINWPAQLALREKRQLVIPLAVWVLITLVCTLAGPFGTFEALAPFARLAYWAVIVGVSVLFSTLLSRMQAGSTARRLTLWTGFVIGLSVFNWGVNALLFEVWREISWLLYLIPIVGVIVLIVHGVFWLINLAHPEQSVTVGEIDPQTRFLRRIPLADRGSLVRIEAQDHYLKVVTDRGAPLILLRLSEAVEELGSTGGLQVHRSHWVALDAVTGHRREKGRDLLILADGAEVPVSRSNRDAAKAAGLF